MNQHLILHLQLQGVKTIVSKLVPLQFSFRLSGPKATPLHQRSERSFVVSKPINKLSIISCHADEASQLVHSLRSLVSPDGFFFLWINLQSFSTNDMSQVFHFFPSNFLL